LSSGLHSPVFLQKMFVFQDPARTERLCRALAEKAREAFGAIDVVASPALGGIVPGYETARWLGAKAIFVERDSGVFKLRRGFGIPAGARVLMVEDIITTGLSSREALAALAEHPGKIVGAACLIDRSDGKADIGVKRVALATLDIPAYAPDALPPNWRRFQPSNRGAARSPARPDRPNERGAADDSARLGVNVDHVATVATRAAAVPDPVRARCLRSKIGATASPRTCGRTADAFSTTTWSASRRRSRSRSISRWPRPSPCSTLRLRSARTPVASCRKSERNEPPKAGLMWSAASRP
jgi:orotate phosphoribosyltransferase